MIPGPSAADLGGALTWEPVVSAWLGTRWLADVPVAGGSVTWSTRREVQGSLDLVVPRQFAGRDWLPDDDAHPLATKGQVLAVAVRVSTVVTGASWVRQLGRFLVTGWEAGQGVVQVTGVSLGQRIIDDAFTSPTPSRPLGTFVSELRRLVPASLGVAAEGLTDRLVPTMAWGESRMDALKELAKAWPCRIRESDEGTIRALPPLGETAVPVVTLTDGVGGTVVSAYGTDTRDGIFNVWVVRGRERDELERPTVQAVSTTTDGPFAVDTYGRVVTFFESELVTSYSAAENVANALRQESLRPARTVPVELAADPRIELDDAVQVLSDTRDRIGWVSGLTFPLVPDSPMRLDLEVAADMRRGA